MLFCSGSAILAAFKNGDPDGYNGTTWPPGRIGGGVNGVCADAATAKNKQETTRVRAIFLVAMIRQRILRKEH
jgi:hypothetical protein